MRKTQLASCLVIVSLLGSSQFTGAADPAHSDQPTVAPEEAISRLKEGNGRYTNGNLQHPGQTAERRTELAKTQHPFAAIVSCSDSRVPPEIVFDFFFQAEDGIRDYKVTGVQTCALPI